MRKSKPKGPNGGRAMPKVVRIRSSQPRRKRISCVMIRSCSLTLIVVLIVCCGNVSAADVDFARDVLPILQRSCFECHGAKKTEGGLRLDQAAGLAKGGDSGAVVIAKKPADSELLRRISLPKND